MILVALPAYNEEKYITNMITRVKKYADEVIVLDDGSTDDTFKLAKRAGAVVIRHSSNRGYGAAIQSILLEARKKTFNALVIIDADNQHFPSDIPNLIKPIICGYDIVIGSRKSKDIPRFRFVGGKVLSIFTVLLSGVNVNDSQSGFRAYSRRAVNSLKPQEKGMAIGSEVLYLAGKNKLKIKEVPISIKYTNDSSTHNPIKQGLYTLYRVFIMIFKRRLGNG